MSEAGASVSEGPTGPPVGDDEDLYRCISPAWWVADERRVSSAAFSYPVFSVVVASLAKSPQATLSRFRPGSGIASFLCRAARQEGCEVHLEVDAEYPENQAHAHVYMPKPNSKRKTAARKLADVCRILIPPKPPE